MGLTIPAAAMALSRSQDWRFGDIIQVEPAYRLHNDDRRWLVVGHDGRRWATIFVGPNNEGVDLGIIHWDDLDSFELVGRLT